MMRNITRALKLLFLCIYLFAGLGKISPTPVAARANPKPQYATAYELIEAVNQLRARNGLFAYGVNSILMQTAQAQADYMASIGTVTHTGPGGSSVTDRLLAAGYPLAGDLSLGGLRAENILSASPSASGADIVNSAGWADALHQNTMLSPNLTEIGAGVSVSGGVAYYVIDCALPGGAPVAYTPSVGTTPGGVGTAPPTIGIIFPNTPAEDGSVSHTVKAGETLYSISIAYKVSIDEIMRLNRLTTNLIYPGDALIIKPAAPVATATLTGTSTPAPTVTPFVFWTVTSSPAPTSTPIPAAPVTGGGGALVVGVIIVAALVLAGVLTASGAKKRSK